MVHENMNMLGGDRFYLSPFCVKTVREEKKGEIMKLLWKYLKKHWIAILINFACAFGFVLIEIGIPTVFAEGINSNFMQGDKTYIIHLALQMLLFAVIGLLMLIALAYSTDRTTSAIVRDVRNDLFGHIQTFSKTEYEAFGVSRLINNTGNDSYMIMLFATMLLRTGLVAPLMIISSVTLIYLQSPFLALLSILMVPLMFFGIYGVNKITGPLSHKQQKSLDRMNKNMRESLTGLRVIRAFQNEEFQENRFYEENGVYQTLSKKLFQKSVWISIIFTIVFRVIIAVILYIGAVYVNAGDIAFGSLAAFVEYLFHALFSFLMLGTIMAMYPRFYVATSRIEEVLNAKGSITSDAKQGIRVQRTKGILSFEDVSFSYADSAEEAVLEHISFTASPGETVAFIGSTGSGKSTLIKLLPRLLDYTSGRITLDGVDIKDYYLPDLRKQISYVPQKAVLFSGSIRENLLFGNRDATQEELERAAEIAQAEDFIQKRPNGYDEILSEGGINLSGGQKQRLCIARALTRNAPVYIFDDSFSALDYKTDATLRKRLKAEIQDATILIVAQRIGTIMDADKIIVLHEGTMVGCGTHKQLLKENTIYREIAKSQLSEEELNI